MNRTCDRFNSSTLRGMHRHPDTRVASGKGPKKSISHTTVTIIRVSDLLTKRHVLA